MRASSAYYRLSFMRETAIKTIAARGLITPGARVLVCLSGGADSVALLHFLYSLRDEWKLVLGAMHLNHCLRGAESDGDEAFVRGLCAAWNIPLKVERADVAALARESGESLELAGRGARYAFFEREGERQDMLVATAHTRSDSAETLLLNLTRGTGLRGLCGIPARRGRVVRPLIDCTRRQIETYCAEHGLAYRNDASNQSDIYTRNRVRHTLLPLLERENPRFLQRLGDMTELLRADADYLDALAEEQAAALRLPGGGVERTGFVALPPALRGRVLLCLLREAGVEAGAPLVASLTELAEHGSGKRRLSADRTFLCAADMILIEKMLPPQAFFERAVPVAGGEKSREIVLFPGKVLRLTIVDSAEIKKTQIFKEKGYTDCVDYDRIGEILLLRQRKPSDTLRPVGRGCTKTLKKLFQEAKVSPDERLRRVVAESAGRVIWLEGAGADESAAASERSGRILIIEYGNEKIES